MTIASLTIVKNGADIIEPFIRHNAAHVDCFLICDHQSDDGTAATIRRLREDGYRIYPYSVESAAFRQSRWMTYLAHEAKSLFPRLRYVMPLDVDEFIQVKGGAFASVVAEHFSKHCDPIGFAPWVTYVPTSYDDNGEANPVARIRHRFASEPTQVRKIVLPAASIRALFDIRAGSHAAKHRRHKLKGRTIENVALAHFPVRALEQVRRKAVEGTEASRAIQKRKPGVNIHWKQLADAFENERQEMDNLESIARRYLGAGLLNDTAIIPGDFEYLGDKPRRPSTEGTGAETPFKTRPPIVSLLRRCLGPANPRRLF